MKTLCSVLVIIFVARLCACDSINNSKKSLLNSTAENLVKTSKFSVSNTSTSNINNARKSARNEALHIHYASIQLDKFVRNLKLYISETHFKYPVFETSVAELKASFSGIAELYEHVIPCPENLTRQIEHASAFFKAMLAANKHMTNGVSLEDPFHRLLSDLHELKLSVLAMLDSHGSPDVRIYNYFEKVDGLKRRSYWLERSISELGNAPLYVVMEMHSLFESTENALNLLAHRVPKPQW
ncbi:hypothetical protein OXX79_008177 [Metschnikowia pulcherrima]